VRREQVVALDEDADPAGTGPAALDEGRDIAPLRRRCHADRLFRSRVRRLHQLGPRPVGELLGEIVARYPRIGPFVDERLAVLAGLDPAWVRWTGADDWLEPADVIRIVGGRS
jgi:hypothetical protein